MPEQLTAAIRPQMYDGWQPAGAIKRAGSADSLQPLIANEPLKWVSSCHSLSPAVPDVNLPSSAAAALYVSQAGQLVLPACSVQKLAQPLADLSVDFITSHLPPCTLLLLV